MNDDVITHMLNTPCTDDAARVLAVASTDDVARVFAAARAEIQTLRVELGKARSSAVVGSFVHSQITVVARSLMRVPEAFRVRTGPMASDARHGNNGAFRVRLKGGQTFNVIASDGAGWEHVSVSRSDRCPTWGEMCQVRNMFWAPDAWVIQYHPAATDYVNEHPYCLHMWRPLRADVPKPPTWMVG